MRAFLRHLFVWFLHLGPFGLIILGVLDSSFLIMPLGNDMLLTVLVAGHRSWFPIYVAAAAFGSTAGILLTDVISRKSGEEGLQKLMKPKVFDRLKKRVNKGAALALIVACLAPPPFPFVPVVSVASALQYPRKRLLGVIFAGRLLRFSLVGLAALWLGERVLHIMKSKSFVWFMVGFIVVCAVASGFALFGRIKRGRQTSADSVGCSCAPGSVN